MRRRAQQRSFVVGETGVLHAPQANKSRHQQHGGRGNESPGAAAGLHNWGVQSSRKKASRSAGSFARTAWLATAITLAAAFFRFFMLDRYPVGFYFDEAANLFDIFGLGPSFHPIFFPNNNGREPFFFYWAALFVRPLAVTPYSLRLAAAFLGVATIPA